MALTITEPVDFGDRTPLSHLFRDAVDVGPIVHTLGFDVVQREEQFDARAQIDVGHDPAIDDLSADDRVE
ncbi:hypothetical protein D3C81_2064860 [compost metagenome]